MKALKYILAGVVTIGSYTASFAQQDVKAQVDAITKVIANNKTNLKAAEPQVKEFVKVNKKNAEALTGLGRAYLAVKDTINSKKYGEMAVKVNKKYGDGWILLGDIEAFKDDGGAAAQQYQQAIYFDPQNPQGYIKYAWIYRGRSPQEAVEQLEQLRTIKPDYPVDAEAGHIYYLANNREKSKEYYSKVDVNKLDKSYLSEYARALLLTGDYDKCQEVASFGVKKFPKDVTLNRVAMLAYNASNKYDDAVVYAETLFNKTDSLKATDLDYTNYALALQGTKQWDKAVEMYNKAIDLVEGGQDAKAQVVKMISDVYKEKGDFDASIAKYNEYINMSSKPTASEINGLAALYMEQAAALAGEPQIAAIKNAIATYGILEEKYPEQAVFANFLKAKRSELLDQDRSKALAKPYYEKVANLLEAQGDLDDTDKSRLVTAYEYLAHVNVLQDNNAKALEYCDKALAINPSADIATQIKSALSK